MASIPVSQPLVPAFDASRWLAEWADHGGIYILAGTQLHLRRNQSLDLYSTISLDCLRDDLLRSGGGPAIAELLIRRQNGDVP
jgi:hypothetical protein